MVLFALESHNLVFDWFRLVSRRLRELSSKRFKLYKHLLLRCVCFILSVGLDLLSLFHLKVTDLLVDVHLLLVEGRLVLDSLVKEEAELVRLVDQVDHNGEQSHLLLVCEGLNEVHGLDACKFGCDLGNFFIERTEHVWVFIPGVHQDKADYFRPELLLVFNDLVEGGKDLVLLLTRGGDSTRAGLCSVHGEEVLQVVVREGGHKVVHSVETLLPDMLQLHLLSPVKLLRNLSEVQGHPRIALRIVTETGSQLFKLELWRLKELVEVVAELPDVKDALELLRLHVNLHGCGLWSHNTTVELRHLFDEGVGDGVPD